MYLLGINFGRHLISGKKKVGMVISFRVNEKTKLFPEHYYCMRLTAEYR